MRALFPFLLVVCCSHVACATVHVLGQPINPGVQLLIKSIQEKNLDQATNEAITFLRFPEDRSFQSTDVVAIGAVLESMQSKYEGSEIVKRQVRDPFTFANRIYKFKFRTGSLVWCTALDYWEEALRNQLVSFAEISDLLVEHAMKTESMGELLRTLSFFTIYEEQMPNDSLHQILQRLHSHTKKKLGISPLMKSTFECRYLSYDAYIVFFLLNQGISPGNSRLVALSNFLVNSSERWRDPIQIAVDLLMNPGIVNPDALKNLGETIMLMSDPPSSTERMNISKFNFYYGFFEDWVRTVAKQNPVRRLVILNKLSEFQEVYSQKSKVINLQSFQNPSDELDRAFQGLKLLTTSLQNQILIEDRRAQKTPIKIEEKSFTLLQFPKSCASDLSD